MSEIKTKTKEKSAQKSLDAKAGFSITTDAPKLLKTIVDALASIIDETIIVVTPDALLIKAMDPSRICLLQLTMKKECFNVFINKTETTAAINLDDLDKVLNRCGSDDTITMSVEGGEQKLKIKAQREGSTRTRTFSLSLLDLSVEEIPMENLMKMGYNAKWSLKTELLTDAIKDAEIYSDLLNVSVKPSKVEFHATGAIGEMTCELGAEDLLDADFTDLTDATPSTGAYSIQFLKSILKLASITEKLDISITTDHPLRLDFKLLQGGELNYFLAPRVEDAEEAEEDDETALNEGKEPEEETADE